MPIHKISLNFSPNSLNWQLRPTQPTTQNIGSNPNIWSNTNLVSSNETQSGRVRFKSKPELTWPMDNLTTRHSITKLYNTPYKVHYYTAPYYNVYCDTTLFTKLVTTRHPITKSVATCTLLQNSLPHDTLLQSPVATRHSITKPRCHTTLFTKLVATRHPLQSSSLHSTLLQSPLLLDILYKTHCYTTTYYKTRCYTASYYKSRDYTTLFTKPAVTRHPITKPVTTRHSLQSSLLHDNILQNIEILLKAQVLLLEISY